MKLRLALSFALTTAACAGGGGNTPKATSAQPATLSPPTPPSTAAPAPLPPPPAAPPLAEPESPTDDPAPLAQTIGLKIRSWTWPFSDATADDALANTMATLRFEGWIELDGFVATSFDYQGEVQVHSEPLVLVRTKDPKTQLDPTTLSAADLALLGDLCRDAFASVDNDFESAATATHVSGLDLAGFTVAWRSHHPHTLLEDVGLLLLAKKLEARCGLNVAASWEGAASVLPTVFTFDFAPVRRGTTHPADDYRGTDAFEQFVEALDASVMLLERHAFDWKPTDERWELLAVPEPKTEASVTPLRRGIKALNPKAFSTAAPTFSGTKCVYHETASLRALDPTATQAAALRFTEAEGLAFVLETLDRGAAPGAGAPAYCDDVALTIDAARTGFGLSYSCETYKKIWDEGNCGLRATLRNPADPRNSLLVTAAMPSGNAEIKDLTGAVAAVSILPEDAGNPLRDSTVTLTGFDEAQRQALFRAFDLWLATSLSSYTAYFPSHIEAIEYDGDVSAGATCASAGGYAVSSITNKFFLCPGGAMSPEFLTPFQSAHSMIYRAMVALHETLHTHGEPHDYDDSTIVSCTNDGGTAYAAVIAHDVFTCQEDYCYGLKASAKEELKAELEYSVGDDPRLYTGPCHDWATALGVAFSF